MKWIIWLSLLLGGCGYDCIAKCREVADHLVANLDVPRETVCSEDVFQEADSCEACDQAFAEAYSVVLQESACKGD